MANPLDMSLDDLISSTKKSTGSKSRGRGIRGSESGPSRRFTNRSNNRTTPYSRPVQAPSTAWQHDMFMEDASAVAYPAQANRVSSVETGTKLYISNLDYGVSNEDIKELFSEAGDLKKYSIHYDRSGRSKGTAEVVFSRRVDAAAAFKRYNNVQLDGKPMQIEIVGTNLATQAAPALDSNRTFRNQNGFERRGERSGATGHSRGGGRGGMSGRGRGGRGRGRGRAPTEKVSAEDLDADLDKYYKGAMETD